MSQLPIPKIDRIESKDNYGRFVAEPLAKGFGATLGNALRRVLLGYLPGAAVTHVRLEGIQHEFSPIPNVKEDTLEFLLNIKALRLKPISGQPGKLVLDVSGQGQVFAADIKPSVDFEVANPELYLATLNSSEAKLYVELDVELAEGYRDAESGDNLPVGTIPVDAIFTPVRKVNFTTELFHVGPETSGERLLLEVWTDGTISPENAISLSADTLIKQLSPFASYVSVSRIEEEKELIRSAIPDEIYNMPVEQLDLSVRTINCLRRGGIATVGELISKGEQELLSLRNFGQKSKQELDDRLKELGLTLAHTAGKEDKEVPAETEIADALADETAAEDEE
ncbi:MAG: DNA-directed RNA polymerase subunit alpha [Dehalococcoidales bacterium]|nr:DNA-directed RNA polymerase subunit alpha [Dehalococcoidales bacterium]